MIDRLRASVRVHPGWWTIAARRDLRGRYRLKLKERPEVLRVSAAHGHLFRRR